MALFSQKVAQEWPHSFLHVQLPQDQGRKPGCREPRFKSVLYLDVFGPIMASVLSQTIVLGRICLLISERRGD